MEELVSKLWVLAAGLCAVAWISYRGLASPRALDGAPHRRADLGLYDLIAGAMFLLLGMSVMSMIVSLLLPVEEGESRSLESLSTVGRGALMLGSQALTVLPACVYLYIRTSRPDGLEMTTANVTQRWRRAGLLPRRPGRELLIGGAALVLAMPLVLATTTLVASAAEWLFRVPTPEIGHEVLESMQHADSVPGLALLLVSALIAAPILEELFYRGLVQSSLLRLLGENHHWQAVVLTSLGFAAIHLGAATWQALPGLFVLSLVLGWLYERSGSLLPSIVTHMAFNVANVLLALDYR